MRILLLLVVCLVPLTGASSEPVPEPAAEATPRRDLLRGSDCLQPSAIRDWQQVESDELVVDAGRRKYRIHLVGSCLHLGGASELKFRGDSISGRICGNAGERVDFGRGSCPIDRVALIDAEGYREAMNRRKGSATATETVSGSAPATENVD